MLLTRVEKLFIAAAVLAIVLTVGFGAGLYHALTTREQITATAVQGSGTSGSAPAPLPDQAPATGASGSSQAAPGGAASAVTSGGAAPRGAGPAAGAAAGAAVRQPTVPHAVAPSVCPFPDGVMTLGSIVSLSGFFQFPEAKNAASAYFQDANAHGGVHGCRVQYQVLDDATSNTTALADAKQLVADDHVLAIVGMVSPFGQDTVDPYFASPGADNAGQAVPLIGIDPYEESAFKFPNQVSVDVPIKDAGAIMAQYAKDHVPFTRPGIFGYNVSQLTAAEAGAVGQFKKLGYSNVDIQTVDPSASQYDQIVQRFAADKVDLLMWFCDIGCGDRFVQAAQSIGYHPRWVNYEIGYDPRYAAQFGQAGGEQDGAVALSPFLPFEAGGPAASLLSTVEHYFPGTSRDSVMEQGWLGAQLFARVVNSLPLSADLHADQAAIIQALNGITSLDLGLTPPLDLRLGVDPDYPGHAPHRCAQFVTISGGALHWNDHSWHCPP
ncbi:MAG TPA: ABC transporter substrate-binding protein [Candidatus Dormibacteraeota bacterium]|nr:ABC transporter substrate-binding protein [Candidatus Dormibacteraeota bacterium]